MEKNIKNNVYVCITESLCCTAEINTILQMNYTSIKKLMMLYPNENGYYTICSKVSLNKILLWKRTLIQKFKSTLYQITTFHLWQC